MKRKFTILAVIFSVLILSSLALQADTGQQKGKPGVADKLAPGQKISDKPGTVTKGNKTPKPVAEQEKPTPNGARVLPAPIANADLASQSDIDKALYTSEEFFGTSSRTKRAFSDSRKQIDQLISRYPKDPRLQLTAAWLDERLENFDQATLEMKQYVVLNSDSAASLRRLSNFYHNRAMFKAQVETLQKLATNLRIEEREPVYREIISIVKDHEVKGFSIEDAYKELLASDKQNVGLVKSYVEELILKRKYTEATTVLTTYQEQYPNELSYFLEKRASVYQEQGDRLKAEVVYKEAFDPLWPSNISTSYYELLRKFGRYRNYRRDLQVETTRNASFNSVARLFNLYAYEENRPLAFSLLKNYEAKRGEQANWKQQELETLAALYISIGQYDEASRYLYTLYLSEGLKPGSKEREKYLSKLFNILMDSGSQPVRLSSGDLSLYRDIAKVDQNPGLLNGVLSLILSNTNIGYEFQQKEANAASYFNRAFAYRIFNSFKQEYASSEQLPVMYDYLMSMFAGFGEHKLVLSLGKEFQTKFPQAPNYNQITLKIADAHVALGQRDAERVLLAQLLDKISQQKTNRVLLPSSRTIKAADPQFDAVVNEIVQDIQFFSDTYNPIWMSKDNGNENYNNNSNTYNTETNEVNYSRILERIVSSYGTEGKKQETLKFFWGEIKKHPKEEGLYERMLQWLESARLFEEQFKVYTAAINNFQDNSWYHSLSRWYIRNKKKAEFRNYSKEIVETLDQADIKEYLDRFVLMSYGKVTDINYDSKFYFELYSYALKRFPNNIAFVNGLLRYYAVEKNWAEWERLSFEYYSADTAIQENLLRYLASKQKLQTTYQQARQKSKTSLAYQQFSADAAVKLSHFDEALDTYKLLVSNYPGETRYALKLGDLMRSFSYQGEKFSEESAKVYLQLARIYPTNHEYKTKAGEVFADMSDFTRARQVWDTILTNELGVPNTYLEVASIYWDYYQYDDAIRVVNNYRDNTGDKTALAYKMGAIYEGKNDWKQAINEYVSVLAEPGVGRDVVIKRLVQLTPRRDFAQTIARSYEQQSSNNPGNWLLSLGYSEYLRSAGRETEADSFLRDQVAKRSEIEFLEAIRDVFHRERLPQDEEQTLMRLTKLARDERESMKYRLQQAEFYEQRRDLTKAGGVFDGLLAQYPNNLGIIQESAQFFSRAGLVDKSIALFKQSAGRAQGDYRKQFTLQLAKQLEKANKLDESEQILRAWYNEHPLDNEFFRNLVALLGKANKQEALVELYQTALKQPATSGLSGDETKAYVTNLRLAMIETLARLNRHSEVVDQYIEVINRQFDNSQFIDAAFRYSQANNQLDRFKAYYEDLAKKSFKDYRWNLVLGAIYAANGETAKQIDQYKLAVTNEPQRLDLRETLAALYTREQRYDEAVTALKRNFEIDGNNPEWLTKIAKVQIQADKPDAAVATLRDSLAKNPKVTAQLLFNAGKLLAERSYTKQAFDFYKEAIDLVKSRPTKEYTELEQISNYSLALLKNTNPVATYQELKDLEAKLETVSSEDDEKNYAYSTKYSVQNFLENGFGKQVMTVCSPKERLDLAVRLNQSVKNINTYDADSEAALRKMLSLAESAGLTEFQESLLVKVKDLSYSVSPNKYYNNVVNLLGFYERFALYAKAAELLQTEKKVGRWNSPKSAKPSEVDLSELYHALISDYWHKAGMADKELATLSEYYLSRSGSATADNSPLVQRYFNLLVELKQTEEFKQIASKSNPYQLQLINFFIVRKEKELALQAIDNSSFNAAWKSSRRAQVGLYFQDTNASVEKSFQVSLDLKPIGQMVKQKPNSETVLTGSDWYVATSNYGVWLTLSQDKASQAHKYIVAKAEDKPSDAVAQLELANFYINSKTFNLAEQHLALANELAPNSPSILVTQGNYHFMRGDRNKAIATWNNLVAKRNSGLLQHNSYFDALASHGLVEESLPTVGRFLSRALTKLSWDELSPFVRKVALAGKNNNNLSKAIADTLYQVIRDNPSNIKLGQMLVQEDLVTTIEAKSTIYRAMLERYQDLLVAVTATGGSYQDGEYYSRDKVASLLDGHERKLIDFLITERQFDQVKQNLRYMQDSHSELGIEITPEWMEMAQAVVELRTGTIDNAVASLKRYVGVAKEKKPEEYTSTVEENRHLKAYTLLINEQQPVAADNLLYEYYQRQLRIGQGTIANYTGIAGVEFRRGHNKEGLDWLGKMVAIFGTADAAIEAGKLAERYELHKESFDWRSQGAKLDPAQVENRLELARNAALIGQNQLGVNILKQLIENRETTNTIRAQAVALIPNVAGSKDAANNMLATFQNNPDYYSQLVTSGLLIAADRKAEARVILQQASKSSTAAQARLMLAALETSEKTANAKGALQDALYSDSKAMVSQAIAFNFDEPNSVLVQAFISNNQLNAALAFSPIKAKRMLIEEDEESYNDSENSSEDSTQNVNFRSFNYEEIDVAAKTSKYLTLAEMATERRKATENKLLESLIDVAIKLGDLPQAIGLIANYQTKITNPQQFALLEGKRKALTLELNNSQAIEEASLKLGTELTQSVLDQLLSKSIGSQTSGAEGEGL